MRRRTVLLTVLIVGVLGISVVALALPEIHIGIPGLPRIDRSATGPLGLKLGLDLQGGAHLVYQAETGTTLGVSFEEGTEVDADSILDALADAEYEADVTQVGEELQFVMVGEFLTSERRATVLQAITDAIAEPVDFANDDVPPPTAEQMEGVLSIISRRVNLFGTEEPIVQLFGDDRIIVQLPGTSGSVINVQFNAQVAANAGGIRDFLSERGYSGFEVTSVDNNTFRIAIDSTVGVDERRNLQTFFADEFGPVISLEVTGGIEDAKRVIGTTAQLEFLRRQCSLPVKDNPCRPPFTDSRIGLTGDDLIDAFVGTDQLDAWVVNIQFNDRGADLFSELTGDINVRTNPDSTELIAVYLDGEELLAPVAQAHIRDGRSQISGNFNRESARTLAIQLKSGRLPVPLRLIQESEVDSLLGAESLQLSLLAGLVGLALVIVFIIAYYRAAGVVAALALIYYAAVTLAIFKLVPIPSRCPTSAGSSCPSAWLLTPTS